MKNKKRRLIVTKTLSILTIALIAVSVLACPQKSKPVSVVDGFVKLELKGESFQMGADYTGSYASYDWEKPVHTRHLYLRP